MFTWIFDVDPVTKQRWVAYAASKNRPLGMAFMMFLRKSAQEVVRKHSGKRIKKRVSIRHHLQKRDRHTRFMVVKP